MTEQPLTLAEDSEINLYHVFDVICRRKTLIIGGTLIVVVAAWLVSVILPKVYEVPIILSNLSDSKNIKSAIPFFRNTQLADSTIKEFGLNKFSFHLTPKKFLDENVDVRFDANSGSINLKVELTDPILTWEVANYMAREGIKKYDEFMLEHTVTINEQLVSKLDKATIQLQNKTKDFDVFRQKVGLANLRGLQYFLKEQRDKLNSMIVQLDIKLATKEAAILLLEDAREEKNQSLKSKTSSLLLRSDGLNDVVESAGLRLIQNKVEYASMKAGREKLAESKRENDVELDRINKKLASLQIELNKWMLRLNLAKEKYALVKHEVEENKKEMFLPFQSFRIVDISEIPEKPVRPRVFLMTTLSGAVALPFFVFLAFLLEDAASRRRARALKSS